MMRSAKYNSSTERQWIRGAFTIMLCVIASAPHKIAAASDANPTHVAEWAEYEFQIRTILTDRCQLVFVIQGAESGEPELLAMDLGQFTAKERLIANTETITTIARAGNVGLQGASAASLTALGFWGARKIGGDKIRLVRKIYELRYRTKLSLLFAIAAIWGTKSYIHDEQRIAEAQEKIPDAVSAMFQSLTGLRPLLSEIKGQLPELDFADDDEANSPIASRQCEFQELALSRHGFEFEELVAFRLFANL